MQSYGSIKLCLTASKSWLLTAMIPHVDTTNFSASFLVAYAFRVSPLIGIVYDQLEGTRMKRECNPRIENGRLSSSSKFVDTRTNKQDALERPSSASLIAVVMTPKRVLLFDIHNKINDDTLTTVTRNSTTSEPVIQRGNDSSDNLRRFSVF